MAIKLKREYDAAAPEDGYRILVDRLWPRGLRKEAARVDLWLRDVAPSPGLRTWFGHDPERWSGFRESYLQELEERGAALREIRGLEEREGTVTLLYAAKDEEHNHARVIAEALAEQ